MVHQYLSTGSISDHYHTVLGQIVDTEKSTVYIDQIDDLFQAEKQRIKSNMDISAFRKLSIMQWEALAEPWMKIMMPVLKKRLKDGPKPTLKPKGESKTKAKVKPKPKPKLKPKTKVKAKPKTKAKAKVKPKTKPRKRSRNEQI